MGAQWPIYERKNTPALNTKSNVLLQIQIKATYFDFSHGNVYNYGAYVGEFS